MNNWKKAGIQQWLFLDATCVTASLVCVAVSFWLMRAIGRPPDMALTMAGTLGLGLATLNLIFAATYRVE